MLPGRATAEVLCDAELPVQASYPYIQKHIEKSKMGNYFISTKEDKNKHGIGQINIERTVDEYDGIIDVKYGDKKFETMIILYG